MDIKNLEKTLEPFLPKKEILKMSNFLKTLVVKNNKEMYMYTTEESEKEYVEYRRSIEDINGLGRYEFNDEDLREYGFSQNKIDFIKNSDHFNLINTSNMYRNFISKLKEKITNRYIEKNAYIAQFQGKPLNQEQWIYVQDLDNPNPDGTFKKIPIHEITKVNNPKTYYKYFIRGDINKVRTLNPTFIYLYYIEISKRINSYIFVGYHNYKVIRYDENIYEKEDEKYFIHMAIYKAEEQIKTRYIYYFDEKYDYFSQAIYIEFLGAIVRNYFTSFLEKYSLSLYSREEIDILFREEGYSNLTNLKGDDLATLIQKNLHKLSKAKASAIAPKVLSDILNDPNISFHRLYLTKQFTMNDLKETDIDYSEADISKNQSLIFSKERLDIEPNESKEISYIEYNKVTDDDPSWSGYDTIYDSDIQIRKTINEYEEYLLSLPIYREPTKYMIINLLLNINKNNKRLSDIYAIMLQFNVLWEQDLNTFPFSTDLIVVTNSVKASPMSIYASIVYLNLLKIYRDVDLASDIIYSDLVTINSPIFQTYENLYDTLEEVTNKNLVLDGQILNKKVSDIISLEDCLEFFPSWDLTTNTTMNDIFTTITSDLSEIEKFEELMISRSSEEDYRAYKMVFEATRKTCMYSSLYEGYTNYLLYIQNKSPELYSFMVSLGLVSNDTYDVNTLNKTVENLTKKYFAYLNEFLVNSEDIFSTDIGSGVTENYLSDIKLILNEFTSVFSEIYQSEFKLNLSDNPYNKLMIRDQISNLHGLLNKTDKLELFDKISNILGHLEFHEKTFLTLDDFYEITFYFTPTDELLISDSFSFRGKLYKTDKININDFFSFSANIKFDRNITELKLKDYLSITKIEENKK